MSTDQAALILYRLDELKIDIAELSARYEKVEAKVEKNAIDTAGLKVKSGVWGVMGGLVPALAVFFYWLFARGGRP
jgi:hypothetical protein